MGRFSAAGRLFAAVSNALRFHKAQQPRAQARPSEHWHDVADEGEPSWKEYRGPLRGFQPYDLPLRRPSPDELMHAYGAVEQARLAGDEVAQIQAHVDLALALKHHRLDARAVEHALAALEISRRLNLTGDSGGLHRFIGHLMTDLGNYTSALEHYASARPLLESAGQPIEAAWCDVAAGVAHDVLARYEAAYAHFELAREVFVRHKHTRKVEAVDELILKAELRMERSVDPARPVHAECAICRRPIYQNDTFTMCRVRDCELFEDALCVMCGIAHGGLH